MASFVVGMWGEDEGRMGKCAEWGNGPNGDTRRMGVRAEWVYAPNGYTRRMGEWTEWVGTPPCCVRYYSPKGPIKTLIYNTIHVQSLIKIGPFGEYLSDAARRRPYPCGPFARPERKPVRRVCPSGTNTYRIGIRTEWGYVPNGYTCRMGEWAEWVGTPPCCVRYYSPKGPIKNNTMH